MTTWAPITSFYTRVSQAAAGDTVEITLVINNVYTASSPISLLGDLTFQYNGQIYAVTYDTSISGDIASGETLLIMGHFTMPSSAVVITAHSYWYGGDGQWHLDDTQTINVSIASTAGWSKVGSSFTASVGFSQTGQWTKVGSIYNVAVALSVTGQWTKLTPKTVNVDLSLTGQWAKLTGKTVSVALKGSPGGLNITTVSLPNGNIGKAYSQALSATGGTTPYTWAIASGTLPAGLSLLSGVISGTPTTANSTPTPITIKVTDSAGASITKALSITIQAAESGGTNWLPWVIGGAAVVGVGAIALMATKSKTPATSGKKELASASTRR